MEGSGGMKIESFWPCFLTWFNLWQVSDALWNALLCLFKYLADSLERVGRGASACALAMALTSWFSHSNAWPLLIIKSLGLSVELFTCGKRLIAEACKDLHSNNAPRRSSCAVAGVRLKATFSESDGSIKKTSSLLRRTVIRCAVMLKSALTHQFHKCSVSIWKMI